MTQPELFDVIELLVICLNITSEQWTKIVEVILIVPMKLSFINEEGETLGSCTVWAIYCHLKAKTKIWLSIMEQIAAALP